MELTHWYNSLRREDDLLIGALDLSFLGVRSTVEVCFVQPDNSPSRIQIETLTGYLEKIASIHTTVAHAIYAKYKVLLVDYRQAFVDWGDDPDTFAPLINQPSQLAPLLTYQTLFIQDAEDAGEFGMGFWSKWEQEHGVGVKFVGWVLRQVDDNSVHYQ